MQNIDFYERKNIRGSTPFPYALPNAPEPDYFAMGAVPGAVDADKHRKRTMRLVFIIAALCIFSFTGGIVMGIKFAGGTKHEIVDPRTYNAMSDIGKRVTTIVASKAPATEAPARQVSLYPKAEYPYAVRIDRTFDRTKAEEVASFLSQKGHTVVLTHQDEKYRVYAGPYKSESEAAASLKKIAEYSNYSLANNARIIKR